MDPEICPLFNSSHSWIYRVTTIYWLLDLIKNIFVRVFVPPQQETRQIQSPEKQWMFSGSQCGFLPVERSHSISSKVHHLLSCCCYCCSWLIEPARAHCNRWWLFFGCCCPRGAVAEERLIALFQIQIPKFNIVCGWRTFEVNVGSGKKGVCGRSDSEKSLGHNYMFLVQRT